MKKKKNPYFLLILLALTLTTCKKIGNSTVHGTVVEKGTGLPFPRIQIWVERTTRSGLNSNLDPRIVANTVTDANGDYQLDFPMRAKFLYDVYATPLEDENGKTYSKVEWAGLPEKDLTADFELPPIAYLKVHLHKTSFNISDRAYITIDNSMSFQLDPPDYPFDSIFGTLQVVADDSITISWMQRYSTPYIWANEYNRVYINKGDTLDHEINFN